MGILKASFYVKTYKSMILGKIVILKKKFLTSKNHFFYELKKVKKSLLAFESIVFQ